MEHYGSASAQQDGSWLQLLLPFSDVNGNLVDNLLPWQKQ